MQVRRFVAPTMREALAKVREALGPDAVILSNRRVNKGVELITTLDEVDYSDEAVIEKAYSSRDSVRRQPDAVVADGLTQRLIDDREQRQRQVEALQAKHIERQRIAPRSELEIVPEPRKERRRTDMNGELVTQMQSELRSLRDMLESQVSGVDWLQMNDRNPIKASVLRRLSRLGLSAEIMRDVLAQVADSADKTDTWRESVTVLANQVEQADITIVEDGGAYALVGPPGVGKTTTIAKLATQYVLRHGPEDVVLLTNDVYRIGATEQLRSIGKILEVPVVAIDDETNLAELDRMLAEKRLILMDTVGLNRQDAQLQKQMASISHLLPDITTLLVLPATSQLQVMKANIRAYQRADLAGAIITHTDEAVSLGEVLTALISCGLAIAYCSGGETIPDDLDRADGLMLVKKAIELAKSEESSQAESVAVEKNVQASPEQAHYNKNTAQHAG